MPARGMFQNLATDAGVFLHHLDVGRHTEDKVRTAIVHFPSVLSHTNVNDRLPIDSSCGEKLYSIHYVVGRRRIQLSVGGEGKRVRFNVHLDVFKRLQQSGLLSI